jgi:Ca-activated chloride channel family protein
MTPALVALTLTLAGLLGGSAAPLTASDDPVDWSGPRYVLRVMASDELTDMEPVLKAAASATGVTVVLTPTTTREGTAKVASGQAGQHHDAVWLAANSYLRMTPGALARTDASSRIMSSPVVLGLRRRAVDRLGWHGADVGWADIAAAGGRDGFTFGMADPHVSNTGVSALVGIATAVAGDGAALELDGVRRAADPLRDFFGAQALKAHSTAALVDAFVHSQNAGTSVDGLVEYESVLLSLNASGRLREPFEIVLPSDGVATADYPLTLLAGAGPEATSAYHRLVGYLRSVPVQREIMRQTNRRPVVPGAMPAEATGRRLFELPFPNRRDVVDGLVTTYYGRLRRPARTVYILDTSGSMKGRPMADLQAAVTRLAADGGSGGSRATRFQEREQATLLPFRGRPDRPTTFVVPESDPAPVLRRIRDYASGLRAGGETGIYDALVEAYRIAGRQAATDPDRITTFVLLTDGRNTAGRGPAAFTAYHRKLPPGLASVRVFPILFGNSDVAQMHTLAELTGAQTFDARNEPLDEVFAEIRADQ